MAFGMEIDMTDNTQPTIRLSDLPTIGKPLDGGHFAGITTNFKGQHYAVVLLPEQGSDLTHAKAKAWAKKLGGELPTRPVAAMLFANLKKLLREEWHWTADTQGASYAWGCYFDRGGQYVDRKSFEGSAVAVRYITIGDSK